MRTKFSSGVTRPITDDAVMALSTLSLEAGFHELEALPNFDATWEEMRSPTGYRATLSAPCDTPFYPFAFNDFFRGFAWAEITLPSRLTEDIVETTLRERCERQRDDVDLGDHGWWVGLYAMTDSRDDDVRSRYAVCVVGGLDSASGKEAWEQASSLYESKTPWSEVWFGSEFGERWRARAKKNRERALRWMGETIAGGVVGRVETDVTLDDVAILPDVETAVVYTGCVYGVCSGEWLPCVSGPKDAVVLHECDKDATRRPLPAQARQTEEKTKDDDQNHCVFVSESERLASFRFAFDDSPEDRYRDLSDVVEYARRNRVSLRPLLVRASPKDLHGRSQDPDKTRRSWVFCA